MKNLIIINGELAEVLSINNYGYGYNLVCDNGREYTLFHTREDAGTAAREYWEDMAKNDKEEFTCMVGEKTLIAWCLGEYAGPGTTQTNSLNDWLDLWLYVPEEQWAMYDGNEIESAQFNNNLANEIDTEYRKQVVLYRTN